MYKAYFENAFLTSEEAKTTLIDGPEMLYLSTSGKMDTNGDVNLGFKQRKKEFKMSRAMLFPLHVDFFQQQKLLPPQVTVGINFHPSSNQFRIRSGVGQADRNQVVVIGKSTNLHG